MTAYRRVFTDGGHGSRTVVTDGDHGRNCERIAGIIDHGHPAPDFTPNERGRTACRQERRCLVPRNVLPCATSKSSNPLEKCLHTKNINTILMLWTLIRLQYKLKMRGALAQALLFELALTTLSAHAHSHPLCAPRALATLNGQNQTHKRSSFTSLHKPPQLSSTSRQCQHVDRHELL